MVALDFVRIALSWCGVGSARLVLLVSYLSSCFFVGYCCLLCLVSLEVGLVGWGYNYLIAVSVGFMFWVRIGLTLRCSWVFRYLMLGLLALGCVVLDMFPWGLMCTL